MEIHVKDNAINSLEIGIDFYKKFILKSDTIDVSVKRYGDLKFATIAIHNSIELLTKAILLDINDFLVFDTDIEKDNMVCQSLRRQYDRKKRKANIAYHAVFSTNLYKTIDYSKGICILYNIFKDKISNDKFIAIKDLAEYRNRLTHLGYASTFEWYKILIVLNKSLELILDFYVNNLINSEEYFSKSIIKKIYSVLNISKPYIYDVWMASWDSLLEEIEQELIEFLNSDSTVMYKIDMESKFRRFKSINFSYCINEHELKIGWIFKYSFINDAIIVCDNNEIIVGCIYIGDRSLVFEVDEHGIPHGIKNVYILVPKRKLVYKDEVIYNEKDKELFKSFSIKQNKFSNLIENYIRNIR